MIPKTIHYCWFGRGDKPKSADKCIASWKKFFPDYEIMEWNEENYDVRKISYTSQAYDAKKYAFVSDYARFDILYQYGGIYFDTDVEVIKPFDDILINGAFIGCEIDGAFSENKSEIKASCSAVQTNPGLGLATVPGLQIYKEILDFYETLSFINTDGTYNTATVVGYTTYILLKNGLKNIKGIQTVAGITVYPKEYFNPLDSSTGKLEITENTHSIHWYSMSWLSPRERIRSKITQPFHRLFGNNCFDFLKKL